MAAELVSRRVAENAVFASARASGWVFSCHYACTAAQKCRAQGGAVEFSYGRGPRSPARSRRSPMGVFFFTFSFHFFLFFYSFFRRRLAVDRARRCSAKRVFLQAKVGRAAAEERKSNMVDAFMKEIAAARAEARDVPSMRKWHKANSLVFLGVSLTSFKRAKSSYEREFCKQKQAGVPEIVAHAMALDKCGAVGGRPSHLSEAKDEEFEKLVRSRCKRL